MPGLGQDRATSKLRYDALYLHGEVSSAGDDAWFRFWPDGRAMCKEYSLDRPITTLPTAADGDNFVGTGIARYCVIGDRITIQFYSVRDQCWHFYVKTGTMDSDGGFTLTWERWEHSDGINIWPNRGHKIHESYRPHVVGPMSRLPDWDL